MPTMDKSVALMGQDTNILPMILNNDYKQMFGELVKMNRVSKVSALMTQIYASWILHLSIWENATIAYYRDLHSGDKYERIEDAPPDVRGNLQYFSAREYASGRDFLFKLSKKVPWFNVRTFMSRHHQIMAEVKLWAVANETEDVPEVVFAKVCEDVLFNGASIVGEMVGTFFTSEKGRLVLDETAPIDALGIGERPEDKGELAVAVAKKVSDILADVHDEVKTTGQRKRIFDKYRRRTMIKGTVSGYYADTTDSLGIYYTPAETDGAGDWVLEPSKKYIAKFYLESDPDTPIEISAMEKEVRAWLSRAFHVGATPIRIQPWE